MIKISSENKFFLEKIKYLFNQKTISTISDNNYLVNLFFEISDKDLKVNFSNKSHRFSLPLDFNFFFATIYAEVASTCVKIREFNFYPFQRNILGSKKKCLLSDIQNRILILLIVNKDGINKKFLYESIWPNDKDISINKLDTHLTNLKNQIKLDLSLNINFISQEKILNLIIN